MRIANFELRIANLRISPGDRLADGETRISYFAFLFPNSQFAFSNFFSRSGRQVGRAQPERDQLVTEWVR